MQEIVADDDSLEREMTGVYRSTVDALPHPVDDFDGWRRRWDELALIAAEIDSMLPPLSTSG